MQNAGQVCDIISFISQLSCKVLQFFHQYMLGCNYFWMLCEGIYLHTLIVVAVFAEEQRLHWYYLLGWGMYVIICRQMVSSFRCLNFSNAYPPEMYLY